MAAAARFCFFCICFVLFVCAANSHENKYTAEANAPGPDLRPLSLKELDKPFRMAKLNLLWSKAKLRLTESKLKSILGELKIHDKEEMALKRAKAEGLDKEGLKEAELRKKLLDIMTRFDLVEHFEDVDDPSKYRPHKPLNDPSENYINKSFFKDKKLKKLWEKAETAGFTTEELEALKEEFNHHQDKIDEYYSLLHDVKDGSKDVDENTLDEALSRYNTIDAQEEPPNPNHLQKVTALRDQHQHIKENYDRLQLLASQGPESKEFIEPKVQGLWRVALESNFTPNELESLRVELRHYENRLLKLRHLQVEAALHEEKHNEKQKLYGAKTPGMQQLHEDIKKHARKVDKLHVDLESRIMQRHVEL